MTTGTTNDPTATRVTGAVPRWSPAAVLGQAADLLADAEREPQPADRYRLAHLAALRATAAVLAVNQGPATARARRRPTSAWVLLESAAPHLSCWAQLFASGARLRAAVEAGADRAVGPADAAWQVAAAAQFLDVVAGELDLAADRREAATRAPVLPLAS